MCRSVVGLPAVSCRGFLRKAVDVLNRSAREQLAVRPLELLQGLLSETQLRLHHRIIHHLLRRWRLEGLIPTEARCVHHVLYRRQRTTARIEPRLKVLLLLIENVLVESECLVESRGLRIGRVLASLRNGSCCLRRCIRLHIRRVVCRVVAKDSTEKRSPGGDECGQETGYKGRRCRWTRYRRRTGIRRIRWCG